MSTFLAVLEWFSDHIMAICMAAYLVPLVFFGVAHNYAEWRDKKKSRPAR